MVDFLKKHTIWRKREGDLLIIIPKGSKLSKFGFNQYSGFSKFEYDFKNYKFDKKDYENITPVVNRESIQFPTLFLRSIGQLLRLSNAKFHLYFDGHGSPSTPIIPAEWFHDLIDEIEPFLKSMIISSCFAPMHNTVYADILNKRKVLTVLTHSSPTTTYSSELLKREIKIYQLQKDFITLQKKKQFSSKKIISAVEAYAKQFDSPCHIPTLLIPGVATSLLKSRKVIGGKSPSLNYLIEKEYANLSIWELIERKNNKVIVKQKTKRLIVERHYYPMEIELPQSTPFSLFSPEGERTHIFEKIVSGSSLKKILNKTIEEFIDRDWHAKKIYFIKNFTFKNGMKKEVYSNVLIHQLKESASSLKIEVIYTNEQGNNKKLIVTNKPSHGGNRSTRSTKTPITPTQRSIFEGILFFYLNTTHKNKQLRSLFNFEQRKIDLFLEKTQYTLSNLIKISSAEELESLNEMLDVAPSGTLYLGKTDLNFIIRLTTLSKFELYNPCPFLGKLLKKIRTDDVYKILKLMKKELKEKKLDIKHVQSFLRSIQHTSFPCDHPARKIISELFRECTLDFLDKLICKKGNYNRENIRKRMLSLLQFFPKNYTYFADFKELRSIIAKLHKINLFGTARTLLLCLTHDQVTKHEEGIFKHILKECNLAKTYTKKITPQQIMRSLQKKKMKTDVLHDVLFLLRTETSGTYKATSCGCVISIAEEKIHLKEQSKFFQGGIKLWESINDNSGLFNTALKNKKISLENFLLLSRNVNQTTHVRWIFKTLPKEQQNLLNKQIKDKIKKCQQKFQILPPLKTPSLDTLKSQLTETKISLQNPKILRNLPKKSEDKNLQKRLLKKQKNTFYLKILTQEPSAKHCRKIFKCLIEELNYLNLYSFKNRKLLFTKKDLIQNLCKPLTKKLKAKVENFYSLNEEILFPLNLIDSSQYLTSNNPKFIETFGDFADYSLSSIPPLLVLTSIKTGWSIDETKKKIMGLFELQEYEILLQILNTPGQNND